MAGERKKRKIENEKEEDEDDDERKMEMFFALIRSTRDVRDRLKGGVGVNESRVEKGEDHDEKKMMMMRVEKDQKAIWNPTFRPEDFVQDLDKSQLAGPSEREREREKEEEEDEHKEEMITKEDDKGIDLNLSL